MTLAEYQGMLVKTQNELEYLKKELFDKMMSVEMCCDKLREEVEKKEFSKEQLCSITESILWKAQYLKGLIR